MKSPLASTARRLSGLLLLLPLLSMAAEPGAPAPSPTLTLKREKNWLILEGAHLPQGRIRINYLEAYCRAGSTDADWVRHTYVGHKTETVSASPDGRRLQLRCTVNDGLVVEHDIRAGNDEITFDLLATNPTSHLNEARWAQACPRLGGFAGPESADPNEVNIRLASSFIFLDGHLTRMPTPEWATQGRYLPGQVWAPRSVPRTDVNPRPLNPRVPGNGLIGCFSQDDKWIFALAFEPYQELFQGVAQCLHSDFHIGEVLPGQSKKIRGKIYIVPNDVNALLKRYFKDFPEHQG